MLKAYSILMVVVSPRIRGHSNRSSLHTRPLRLPDTHLVLARRRTHHRLSFQYALAIWHQQAHRYHYRRVYVLCPSLLGVLSLFTRGTLRAVVYGGGTTSREDKAQ